MELEENEPLNEGSQLADAPEVDGRAGHLEEQIDGSAAARRRRRRGGPAMKIESWVFGINGIFFLLVTPSYWFFTEDPTGTAALVMTTLLAFLVTFYLGFHANKMDPRPEDLKEAEVVDGAGELGLLPAVLVVAVVVRAGAGRLRARRGVRLVAVHHRGRGGLDRADRLGLRVLPRRARALTAVRLTRA